jgi:hypothetical protein
MPSIRAKSKIGGSISVVVTRADGRVDDYGVIASNSLWFRFIGRHLARLRTHQLNKNV